MAKFRVWVATNKVGSKCEDTFEIPDEDLAGLVLGDRQDAIEEQAQEALTSMYDYGWEELDSD